MHIYAQRKSGMFFHISTTLFFTAGFVYLSMYSARSKNVYVFIIETSIIYGICIHTLVCPIYMHMHTGIYIVSKIRTNPKLPNPFR